MNRELIERLAIDSGDMETSLSTLTHFAALVAEECAKDSHSVHDERSATDA